MISKYYEFINEAKLEILLETNISFTGKLLRIINSIESPIADKLIKNQYKDIDLKIGLIDCNISSNDKVTFIDQAVNIPAKVISWGKTYSGLCDKAEKLKIFDIIKSISPDNGDTGIILKYLTPEDLAEIASDVDHWSKVYKLIGPIVHFRSQKGDSLIAMSGLEVDSNKLRKTDIKIGRLVKKILDKLGNKYTDSEIEDFVNKYKSKVDLLNRNIEESFSIVKGEDIRKFYLENNYESNNNTLGSSCMRYRSCQSFLDIYTDNKNVEMIILKSDIDQNKIKGRALLWTTIDGKKFMDRVYINKNSDENLFIEYANKNGFIYKKSQNSASGEDLLLNGKKITYTIEVEVEPIDYDLYPYMDTLKFFSYKKGILTNDYDKFRCYYKLESTSGDRNEVMN